VAAAIAVLAAPSAALSRLIKNAAASSCAYPIAVRLKQKYCIGALSSIRNRFLIRSIANSTEFSNIIGCSSAYSRRRTCASLTAVWNAMMANNLYSIRRDSSFRTAASRTILRVNAPTSIRTHCRPSKRIA
jgi:hypothetical protein